MVIAAVTVLGGCRSTRSPAWYADDWRGFPFHEAREKLNDYGRVILVCITADHGERIEREVNGAKTFAGHLHHYTATVVKSYKGNCKTADRVAFVEGFCPCGGERPITTNTSVGNLVFLLVDGEVQAGAEFSVDPFDTEQYDPKTDRLFTRVFKHRGTPQNGFQQSGPADRALRGG